MQVGGRAPVGRAARVEKQQAWRVVNQGLVGVTKDHHTRVRKLTPRRLPICPPLAKDMRHPNQTAANHEFPLDWDRANDLDSLDITLHGEYRRIRPQLVEHAERGQVTAWRIISTPSKWRSTCAGKSRALDGT